MSSYIVPCLFILLIVLAAVKRKNPYNAMLLGAKEGAESVIKLFPTILVIMLALKLMQASGLDEDIGRLLAPVVKLLGIPQELSYLVVLRPVSGSGSIAMLSDIFDKYGADSYIGRCACMIVDGSDTIFYMAGVYFAHAKVKKIWVAVLCALVVSYVGAALGCWLCRFL